MQIYTAILQTHDGRIVKEDFGGYRNSDNALDDIARYFSAIYPDVDSCVVTLPDGKEIILGLKREIDTEELEKDADSDRH